MSVFLKIDSCKECPFVMHGGGFGQVAYIPLCSRTKKPETLPYTTHVSASGRFTTVTASMTGNIPNWCPLRDPENVNEEHF